MNGFTKYIMERAWEDTITKWFVLVNMQSNEFLPNVDARFAPAGLRRFSDSEVITASLIIETLF